MRARTLAPGLLPGLLAGLLASLLAGGLVPAAADEARRIAVIGRAQEERAPDFAEIEIGVVVRAPTPAAALDGASAAARGVIAAARAMGVGPEEIGTTAVTLAAQTREIRQPDGATRERPDGYEAGNRVRVRLADMGRLGELLRRALEAGADRIEGIGFGLRDPAAAQAAVQVAAMADARAQAERLAREAGVGLGPVVSITAPPRRAEGLPAPYALRSAKAAPGRAAVPIEAGTLALSAEVEAVFAILP